MSKSQYNTNNAYELLIWQLEAGIDQCIDDEPNNRLNKKPENLESIEKHIFNPKYSTAIGIIQYAIDHKEELFLSGSFLDPQSMTSDCREFYRGKMLFRMILNGSKKRKEF